MPCRVLYGSVWHEEWGTLSPALFSVPISLPFWKYRWKREYSPPRARIRAIKAARRIAKSNITRASFWALQSVLLKGNCAMDEWRRVETRGLSTSMLGSSPVIGGLKGCARRGFPSVSLLGCCRSFWCPGREEQRRGDESTLLLVYAENCFPYKICRTCRIFVVLVTHNILLMMFISCFSRWV